VSASWRIVVGDCRKRLAELPPASAQTCVTSPPYFGLRDYDHDDQIGREPTPEEFIEALVEVFREVRRVLRDDGTVWLNLGDSYSAHGAGAAGKELEYMEAAVDRRSKRVPGVRAKNLLMIPARVAIALQDDGWYLRSDIIWHKTNPLPESVTDRPSKAHEYLFLLSKNERYFYDADAIREPHTEVSLARQQRGRSADHKYADGGPGNQTLAANIEAACHPKGANKRTVWTVATQPYPGAHFATFPPKLIEPCVLAGSRELGTREVDPIISTPTGERTGEDPTMETGRPVPPGVLEGWLERGWIERVQPAEMPLVPEAACTVLDPFAGAGTTGLVALRNRRSFVGVELNADYADQARQRIRDDAPLFNVGAELSDQEATILA
jgi:DNA modification methylase